MSSLIFKPIVPITIMSIFTFIMLVIVLINRKHIINRILILALVFLISQRPMIMEEEDSVYSLNLDVIFVVDTTLSMLAEDVKEETRIDLVKKICKDIVNTLPGSRFSIIAHHNAAFIKYPFSFDNAAILSVIDSIKIVEPNYSVGSSLSLPADYMKMLLNSSIITTNKGMLKREKIVFFFGDGELNNTEKLQTDLTKYDGMDKLIDNGAVIGIGTTEGGKIVAKGSFNTDKYTGGGKYIIDYSTQKPAISKLNEDNLKQVATKLGIDYFNYNSGKLTNKLAQIKDISEQETRHQKIKKENDIYYYFTFALMILLIYELYYYRRNEL